MNLKLLAASTVLALVPAFVTAGPISLSEDNKVSFKLKGKIKPFCIMQVVDNAGAGNLALDNTLETIGSVEVWCNDGTGFANIHVTSTNNGKLKGSTPGQEIDYSFRFHENKHAATFANTGVTNISGYPHLSLGNAGADIVTDIWTKKDAGNTKTLAELFSNPPVKKLYIQTDGVDHTTMAGKYTDKITLVIKPTSM